MDTKNILLEDLTSELAQKYGEVIGGKTLWHVLGYHTLSAFKQSIARGTLTLTTFFIEGRKGRHALTSDVAVWLVECRAKAGEPSSIELPESFRRTKKK